MNFTRTSAVEQSVEEAVQVLAALLKVQPEFAALERAAGQVHADPQAQRLLRDIRATQGRLRRAWSPDEEAKLAQLNGQLEALPSMQAYRQAERPVRDLCRATGAIISEAAGVAFAANARRSCCGG